MIQKYKILAVDLLNFQTFTSQPGADEFSKEFAAFEKDKFYFRFFGNQAKQLAAAEKKLKTLKLNYHLYFGIELTTDEDLASYPAIAATPLVDYDLLSEKNGKTVMNFKKIGTKNYLMDFTSQKFIFTEKAKKIFDKYCPDLKYEIIVNDKNKKKYFIPLNIPELADPITILHAESIEGSVGEDYEGTFYAKNTDGRITLSDKSLIQLNKENFCVCSFFQYKEKIYRQASKSILASGRLALELKNNFSIETSPENFTYAYTLNNL